MTAMVTVMLDTSIENLSGKLSHASTITVLDDASHAYRSSTNAKPIKSMLGSLLFFCLSVFVLIFIIISYGGITGRAIKLGSSAISNRNKDDWNLPEMEEYPEGSFIIEKKSCQNCCADLNNRFDGNVEADPNNKIFAPGYDLFHYHTCFEVGCVGYEFDCDNITEYINNNGVAHPRGNSIRGCNIGQQIRLEGMFIFEPPAQVADSSSDLDAGQTYEFTCENDGTVTLGKTISVTPTLPPNTFPQPTNFPTFFPTGTPVKQPSVTPTNNPTGFPTNNPTDNPTLYPSTSPTNSPTSYPTNSPTYYPTTFPTANPTNFPTDDPTVSPTEFPTEKIVPRVPSLSPTTTLPTVFPTENPTLLPTSFPSTQPTKIPTSSPVNSPVTSSPTKMPLKSPSKQPTSEPIASPTSRPSSTPTTTQPTKLPTPLPSGSPTKVPTSSPSAKPTTLSPTRPGETRAPTLSTNSPSTSPFVVQSAAPTSISTEEEPSLPINQTTVVLDNLAWLGSVGGVSSSSIVSGFLNFRMIF